MDELEHAAVAEVERRADDIVALATDLIGFNTTTRETTDAPAREEGPLQEYLARRLREAGAEVEVWEPRPEDVAGTRLVPSGWRFDGRPQLLARFAGRGGGRSLLLNGHVDVVSAEPSHLWTSDPFRAEVREGMLYGRGACDMKGGVACIVAAAEALAAAGIPLAGDLLVNTVTDEESAGAGGLAAVAHGVRADAGIVTEPSGFVVRVACQGSMAPTVIVPGRPGHAAKPQPHWRDGGAVNAIEKALPILNALLELRDEWQGRPDQRHPYLVPGTLVPTVMQAGEWMVTYPADCRITFRFSYLPAHADAEGWGTRVEGEVRERIERAAAQDDWLAEHPPIIEWGTDVPPAEVAADDPIVELLLQATADAGRDGVIGGLDAWHDAATFTLHGTPTVSYGPGSLGTAHAIDEHVPVADLVDCTKALVLAAIRFCGRAEAR
jgi:acetylornithine deacetylase